MTKLTLSSLLCALLLLAGSAVADERQDCLDACAAQFDQCSAGCSVYACVEECWYYQDQCEQACPTCTPNWQEVDREVQGTYGTTRGFFPDVYCEHHKVEWVTEQDMNHCGQEYRYYCDNTQDGVKFGTSSVDCCDGTPDSTFTCNHYHDCTG